LKGLIERPDRRNAYQNLDDVEFRGVELASGGWFTERWFARLAYTYLNAEEELPDGTERQLRSRAKHSGYGELRYRFPYNIDLNLNGIYSDGLYDLDGDQNHVELPNYFVLHVKATKAFTDSLSMYVSVSNIFDEDYEHRLDFPREGRAFVVGATFQR
jgi:outer membrane cobalamin receptor